MKQKLVNIKGAASGNFPLSPALAFGNLLFVSGHVSKDMRTGKPVLGDVKVETEQIIKNIEELLKEAGSSLDCVLKTTVFITREEYFADMNEVYSRMFSGTKPTRSTVIVGLAGPFKVEIEAIAYIP